MFVDFNQIWGELSLLDIVDCSLELHLNFLNLLRLLLLLSLEVEVIDVLRVKRLYPFRYYQSLLQKLHFFVLPIILSFVAQIQIGLQFRGEKEDDFVYHFVEKVYPA